MIQPVRAVGVYSTYITPALFGLRAPRAFVLAQRMFCGSGTWYAPCARSRLICPNEPAETWHAWPAHAPFADEIKRWWPSDIIPSALPAVIIRERDVSSLVIAWPARGTLIDLWI